MITTPTWRSVMAGSTARCPPMRSEISSAPSLTGSPGSRPPGQVAVKDRVNAIALAPVEDFRRDSDLFGEEVRAPDAQRRIAAALKQGFQTRDAELALGSVLDDLPDA